VEELNVSFPPEGAGWATMSQIAEATGRDHQCIRLLLKRKNAEARKYKAVTAGGKVIITPHYRIIDG
jgi:IS30 family transposase